MGMRRPGNFSSQVLQYQVYSVHGTPIPSWKKHPLTDTVFLRITVLLYMMYIFRSTQRSATAGAPARCPQLQLVGMAETPHSFVTEFLGYSFETDHHCAELPTGL